LPRLPHPTFPGRKLKIALIALAVALATIFASTVVVAVHFISKFW
jgi:hypothetical protein